MYYIDYHWDLEPETIVLDKELPLDKLGWAAGDKFEIVDVDGRLIFKKIMNNG